MYPGETARRLNYEFHARLKKRLQENKQAIQYLTNRGLTLDVNSSCKCNFLFFEKDLLRRSVVQPLARAVV
jgi:hypothetical protein